ncbi:MAG: HlyD family efflux transporter periplasmic adaptor subunit [Pseudomonadota bacterium]
MDKQVARPWLSLQCQMIPGVRHAVFAANRRASGDFGTLETWPDGADAPAGMMAVLHAAMASGATEVSESRPSDGDPVVLVASPLRRGGEVCGGVAVEVTGLQPAQVPVVVQLMNWGSAWPAFLADQDDARKRDRAAPAVGFGLELLAGDSLSASLAAAATRLARNYGAKRAAIGLRESATVRVAALSGRAAFDRRSEPVRLLEAAMNEACDQEASVVLPAPDADSVLVTEAHARLAGGEAPSAVCTVPSRYRGAFSGAMVVVRDADRPFTASEVGDLEALASLVGAAQSVRRRADSSALDRLREAASKQFDRLTGAGHRRFKLGAAAAAALLVFLGLGTGTHHVSADARLAGIEERELVAPADGFVAESHVRAGARVQAGDLLATLDDAPLKLELARWQSQRDELSNEYHRSLSELNRGAARVLEAQIAQADAQIALVADVIERTRIVAPFDGLVVSGDLSQSAGRPVTIGESLFTVAPLDGYRVVLQVDESRVPDVQIGTTGRLALAALPGEHFDLRVTRLNGMATTADGSNILEVEAALVGDSPHLRPGMKGVARLDGGRARLLGIWTGGLVEKLRMWWWAWSPVA